MSRGLGDVYKRQTEDKAYWNYVHTGLENADSYTIIDGLKEVLKELKSIGRNLNQLVTLAHMGRVTVIDLESVCRAFSELCGAVRMILERKRW